MITIQVWIQTIPMPLILPTKTSILPLLVLFLLIYHNIRCHECYPYGHLPKCGSGLG